MQLDRNIFGEDIVLGSLTIASRDEYKILDQIHNEQICSKFYCEEYFFWNENISPKCIKKT